MSGRRSLLCSRALFLNRFLLVRCFSKGHAKMTVFVATLPLFFVLCLSQSSDLAVKSTPVIHIGTSRFIVGQRCLVYDS